MANQLLVQTYKQKINIAYNQDIFQRGNTNRKSFAPDNIIIAIIKKTSSSLLQKFELT